MKRALAESLLQALGVTIGTRGRTGWVVSTCPFEPWKHDSEGSETFGLSVSDSGASHYNCFSCGSHGDVAALVYELHRLAKADSVLGDYDFKTAMEIVDAELDGIEIEAPEYRCPEDEPLFDTHPFAESWLETYRPVEVFAEARSYLLKRGIGMNHAARMDLRFDSFSRRICFPVRNEMGDLVGLHGRAIDPDNTLRYMVYKYRGHLNQQYWLGESHVVVHKPLIVVEGPFDYASILRVYDNVLAALYGQQSVAKVRRLTDFDEVLTLYDTGTAGDAARAVMRKACPNTAVRDIILPSGKKDPGDLSMVEVSELLDRELGGID